MAKKSVSFNKKGFFQNATDTFHELFLLFAGIVLVGGGLYSIFEGTSFLSGLWWALLTAFVVGYGDVVPNTTAAQVVGMAIMSLVVFVVIPLITLRFILGSSLMKQLQAFLDKQEANESKGSVKK